MIIHNFLRHRELLKKYNNSLKLKYGDIAEISFKENLNPPIINNVSHNIPDSDIIINTLSKKIKDRLTVMKMKFYVTRDVIFNFNINKPIAEGMTVLCSSLGKDDIKIFGLNKKFIKKNLYNNKYGNIPIFGNDKAEIYFEMKDIKEEYLLVECYQYSEVIYRAIFHMTKDEYWNYWSESWLIYKPMTPKFFPKYRVSYLSDLYYRGYKYFIEEGYDDKKSKEKTAIIIKNNFIKYPFYDIGFHSSKTVDSRLIEHYLRSIENKFEFLKNNYSLSSSDVLNELEKYLFHEDVNIDNRVKEQFVN